MSSEKLTPGRCMKCGKPVGPLQTADGLRNMRGDALSHADPQGLFCTMRCAMRYGIDAARAVIAKATRKARP